MKHFAAPNILCTFALITGISLGGGAGVTLWIINKAFAYSKNVLEVWPQKDVPTEYADVHSRGCLNCLLVAG